jgi:glycine hydroxymethyltransferase
VVGVTDRGIDRDPDLCKKIDRAVFPGMQGGPHMNAIAAMAVAFEEDLQPEYKVYVQQVVSNAKALADSLKAEGLRVFGTENHLMVVDCGFEKGKETAVRLEEVGIIVNANTIPHDEASPFRPSGIRIGSPAMTTRGWKETEFIDLGKTLAKIIRG